MKRKFTLINLGLMIVVLFTMLIQSLHSFEHLHQLFQEKECHHKYTGKTEISHQHHPFDHCFVCEFTFGNFISDSSFRFKIIPDLIFSGCNAFATDIIYLAFKGSLFSLRAPPFV